MKEPVLCAYCNIEVDFGEVGNRIVEPYIIDISGLYKVFCSAPCGNKYCIDNNIPFRFCSNPNCSERGMYYRKTIIIPPHAVFCPRCHLETVTTCISCGRKYNSKKSKARKTNDPERFCSIKCEKNFIQLKSIENWNNKSNKTNRISEWTNAQQPTCGLAQRRQ